ncbi:MMPL family transporter [Streptomyces sp. 4N509B]|uniref:MMPL family transporter n=1 Tax=Streptomyces sp. 4N509B TaxID=3457413 RepID=UPI003FD61966
MLAALARTATRRPLTVISAWLLLLVIGFGVGTGVFSRLSDSVPDVAGSESLEAAELLDRVDPNGSTITAVVEGSPPRAEVDAAVADVRGLPGIAEVPDPYATPGLLSRDGEALIIPVTLAGGLDDDAEETAVEDAAERLRQIASTDADADADAADADADDANGTVEVYVSGGPLFGMQAGERAQEDVARAEIISLPVVMVLLLLVFGGFRAAGLPLLVAVCGVAGAFLALFAFSAVTDVSVYAVQVTTMLGLGLAVDYALLMLVRFREERRGGGDTVEDVVEAVHRTVARAGRTVLFSGVTVAVSLTGLLVFPNTFLRSMGLAVAAVVLVDMLAALTLLPALLTRFGRRIPPARNDAASEGRFFARLARFATRRPLAVMVATVGSLVVLALPALGTTIALGDARSLPEDAEARQLFDTVEEHYPTGTGVEPVTVVLGPDASPALADRILALPGTAATATDVLDDGTTVLRLTPAGPEDGPEATRLVEEVRELRGEEPVMVTGAAAQLVDFRAMFVERGPWAVGIVLVGIGALLFAFTGSVLIPLRTIATTLLSLAAALGVVVWVFQDGNLAGLLGTQGIGALSLTAPPLIIAIAFGLAMDYELFILARMREHWRRTGDDREAVVEGLRRSGRVVSCAALLLAVVFAAFMTGGFSPILQIGLGLTLAVLIDATVVRMLLVPASMALLGRRAWWAPGPLRRLHRLADIREDEGDDEGSGDGSGNGDGDGDGDGERGERVVRGARGARGAGGAVTGGDTGSAEREPVRLS